MAEARRKATTTRTRRTVTNVGEARRSGEELSAAIKAINKKFGEGVMQSATSRKTPRRLPTGIFTLDMAFCGGLPIQAISEFHGIRSSGKTTACMKIIEMAQMVYPDKICVLIDQERSFDGVWAAKCGVDLDRLQVITTDAGEDAVDLMEGMIHVDEVCLVILDSIGALVPNKEIEAATEDMHVGIHAKLCTKMMRKVSTALGKEKTRGHEVTVVCINQQRAGIGKWAPPGQDAVSLPGGKAIEHYMLAIVRFKNKENMKKDSEGFDMLDYNEHAFTIEKNKVNAGMRQGEYQFQRADHDHLPLYEGMVDNAPTMLSYAKKMGVYTGGGRSWTINLPDEAITLGSADEHIANLYTNPRLFWRFRNHLIALHAAKLKMPDWFIEELYADDAPGMLAYED